MTRTCRALILSVLVALASPALAYGPYDDARQSLIAGDVGAAMLAIDTGALPVNAQDDDGLTLLHHAARAGSVAAVQALLGRGADPSLRSTDGKLAADLAANEDVLALLQAAGEAAQDGGGQDGAGQAEDPPCHHHGH